MVSRFLGRAPGWGPLRQCWQRLVGGGEGVEAIDNCAHWLEGCACHEQIKTSTSRGRRQRVMTNELGSPGGKSACPWAGRRGTELTLGKKQEIIY